MTRLDQQGVTLTELVVALAIVMITAAIGIPMYVSNIPHQRLKAAGQDLITNLRLARGKAVATNQPYLVCFDTSTQSYRLAPEAGAVLACNSVEKTIGLNDSYAGVAFGVGSIGTPCPEALSTNPIGFPGNAARFSSRGASVDNSSAIVTSAAVYLTNTRDPQRETYCVQVEGTTGRSRLWRWDVNAGLWK